MPMLIPYRTIIGAAMAVCVTGSADGVRTAAMMKMIKIVGLFGGLSIQTTLSASGNGPLEEEMAEEESTVMESESMSALEASIVPSEEEMAEVHVVLSCGAFVVGGRRGSES